MKRIISFVLMLVIMLSLACPAFATGVDSIPNNAPSDGADSPQTGDVIMTWVIVLVLSLVALIAAVWIYRKKIA